MFNWGGLFAKEVKEEKEAIVRIVDPEEIKELKAKIDDLQLLYLKEKNLNYTPRVSILDVSHNNNALYCSEAVHIKEVYDSLSNSIKTLPNVSSKGSSGSEGVHPLNVILMIRDYAHFNPQGDNLSTTTICSMLVKLFARKENIKLKPKAFDVPIVNVATLFIEFIHLLSSNKCGVSFDIPHCEVVEYKGARPYEIFNPILHERFDEALGEYINMILFPGLVVDNQILLRSKVITSKEKPDGGIRAIKDF